MNYYFLELEANGTVFAQHNVAWGGEGPPPMPQVLDGNSCVALTEKADFSSVPSGFDRVWVEGVLTGVDPRVLTDLKLETITTIDKMAHDARARVLAQPTNTEEYHLAAADAQAYSDAGFVGTAPESVASWAYAKRRQGWTDQQSAEDILLTAQRWVGLLLYIRRLRLNAKELIRDATSNLEADLVLETFVDSLTVAMAGVV